MDVWKLALVYGACWIVTGLTLVEHREAKDVAISFIVALVWPVLMVRWVVRLLLGGIYY